ncbi:MAG: NIPSNAP family protein [Chloroflexi bacterium]|nr:NIPSNAP family protein [Chloroflexota bacterium]MQC17390.1 NIPSNAP family protein [Chloroflexota bacterium]
MIYELRTYTANPGKMAGLQARFRDHTCAIFERHGIKNIGYWTNSIGGRSDELIYLLAYEDMASRDQSWAAFQADPDWQRARTESEVDGLLVHHIENRILRATDFSQLK